MAQNEAEVRRLHETFGLLNGWRESGCHGKFAFSTYHNMNDGACAWCGRTEADLITAGAVWLIWPTKPLVHPSSLTGSPAP